MSKLCLCAPPSSTLASLGIGIGTGPANNTTGSFTLPMAWPTPYIGPADSQVHFRAASAANFPLSSSPCP